MPIDTTFIEHVVTGAFFNNDGTLGMHETPDTGAPANGWYNEWAGGWGSGGLAAGGYNYGILVHEIGHGLGLAHPHDDGGGSSIWPGVTGRFDSYGSNNLNQGIFTVMSYNPGWDAVQDPEGDRRTAYGYVGGPMAFDIAAIQYLYGPNMAYHTGNDTYTLPGIDAPGTFWTCIWDADGVDQIVYGGTRNATIDLRAATIDNSLTGGGVPSYVHYSVPFDALSVLGGFTIANGVVIENASGGSGNDTLTGNNVANFLSGNNGADALVGGFGNDSLVGAFGADTLLGNQDNDVHPRQPGQRHRRRRPGQRHRRRRPRLRLRVRQRGQRLRLRQRGQRHDHCRTGRRHRLCGTRRRQHPRQRRQ